MQIALAEAMALLGAPANYTKDDVIAGFRREAKKAHPDAGGTASLRRKPPLMRFRGRETSVNERL
jgi:hypothetical protein